jgi:alpha-tubulin suppressor-like RCC1 family protein
MAAVLALIAAPAATAKTHEPSQPLSCLTDHHWGQFFGGGSPGTLLSPATVTIPDGNSEACVREVGTSNSTEYALTSDGKLWAWGQGTAGELGNGRTADSLATAVRVQFPAQPDGSPTRIASIPTDAMPYDTGLAIDTSGNLWGWGLNKGGELCTGTNSRYVRPVKLTSFAPPVTYAAGADQHLIADAHGVIESCGAGTDGVLGNGTRGQSTTAPVKVKSISGDGADVTALTSSYDNAGVLLADGTYWDWGYNAWGQVGNNTTTAADQPVQVHLPDQSPIIEAAQGGSAASNGQVLVMLADGSLYAWGCNADDQLGIGPAPSQTAPVPFSLPFTAASLTSAGATSYALGKDGNVWAWGAGGQGELGNGTRTGTQAVPVEVDTGAGLASATASNVLVAQSS